MTNNDIQLICLDLDKTLIQENTWYNLNLALGVKPQEDESLFQKYSDGLINYQEWQMELLKMYKANGKADLTTISKSLEDFTYQPDVRKIIKYLKDKNYQLALISGSIDTLVNQIARDLGIQLSAACNSLVFDNRGQLQNIQTCQNEGLHKLEQLEQFCDKLEIKITQCACVGDGDNDLEMFLKTKHGITFKGSKIEKQAWKIIDNLADLKNQLYKK